MIGELDRQAHFKEYLCLDFANRPDHRESATRSVTFAEGGDGDAEALPSVVVDQMGKEALFFLLNWKARNEESNLHIKEIND